MTTRLGEWVLTCGVDRDLIGGEEPSHHTFHRKDPNEGVENRIHEELGVCASRGADTIASASGKDTELTSRCIRLCMMDDLL